MPPANLIFNRADQCFVRGSRLRVPDYDDATEVHVIADDWPPESGSRWDGERGIRPPTTTELQADAEAIQQMSYDNTLEDLGVRPLLLRIIADQERRIRLITDALNAQTGQDVIPPSSIEALRTADNVRQFRANLCEQFGRVAPSTLKRNG